MVHKKVKVENTYYELIKDYKEAYIEEVFLNLYTDYFKDYDYIVGDIAYNKLRLKGFYDKSNKKVNKINNYSNLDKYLEENCAYDCKYFILRKMRKRNEK